MNNTMIVSEALAHLPTIDYRELKDLQGNLKDLTEDNYLRLKTNLLGADGIPSNGFFIPFYVWFEPKTKTPYIVDGHQRQRVLTAENVTPYELPYIEIKAKNKKQAKEKLLLISSQYGKTTREGFEEFAHDLDVDFIKGITTFGGFTLPPMEFGEIQNTEIDYNKLDDIADDTPEEFLSGFFELKVLCESEDEKQELRDKLIADGYKVKM